MQIAADFMNKFEAPITTYVDSTVSTLASNLSGPVTLGATIYIVLFGMMMATGRVEGSAKEFLWSCLKIALIVILVTKPDVYKFYVSDFFFKTIPDEVGGLFVAAGGGIDANTIKDGSAFDQLIAKCFNIGMDIVENASWSDVATRIFGFIFIAVATVVMLLIFMVVLFAKMGLALMIAVGPIFIAMALFSSTRNYTSSWVAMISNFAILQVLIFAFYGLLLSIITASVDTAAAASAGEAFGYAVVGLAIFVLSLVIASQLPGIASSLAGSGIALGSSVMGSAMAATRAGSRFVGRKTAEGAARTFGAGWNATKRAIQGANTVGKGN